MVEKKTGMHILTILYTFFSDKRYICVEGKPLLLIFNPEDVSNLNEMLDYWQKKAVEKGLERY